jgi:hypothetical protein
MLGDHLAGDAEWQRKTHDVVHEGMPVHPLKVVIVLKVGKLAAAHRVLKEVGPVISGN